jgi:hypothetical protein
VRLVLETAVVRVIRWSSGRGDFYRLVGLGVLFIDAGRSASCKVVLSGWVFDRLRRLGPKFKSKKNQRTGEQRAARTLTELTSSCVGGAENCLLSPYARHYCSGD